MDNSKATETMDAPVDAPEDAIPGASETQTRKGVSMGKRKHVDREIEVVISRDSSLKHTLSEVNARIERELKRKAMEMQCCPSLPIDFGEEGTLEKLRQIRTQYLNTQVTPNCVTLRYFLTVGR